MYKKKLEAKATLPYLPESLKYAKDINFKEDDKKTTLLIYFLFIQLSYLVIENLNFVKILT